MRRIIGSSVGGLVALTAMLGLAVASAAASDVARFGRASEVVSKANFYAQTSDGECGLEFTIAYRNRPIKGSIAWTDFGWRLRLPEQGFVVVNGKLTDDDSAVFSAMVGLKGLGVGFYDGTILPIDLTGLDPKPFVACVEYSSRVLNDLH